MEKKANKYHLTLALTQYANGATAPAKQLQLDFTNHDEIFETVERLRLKELFNDQELAAEFANGLKLFSEVMIKNRSNPLFAELSPAFGSFMKRLKSMSRTTD